MGVGEASYGKVTRKSRPNNCLLCRLNPQPSPLIRFSCDLESSFPSWYREVDIFTKGDFLYENVMYALLPVLLLYLLFLKNNQTKISLLPKKHIWGVKFCSPSIPNHILSYLFYFHVLVYHLH